MYNCCCCCCCYNYYFRFIFSQPTSLKLVNFRNRCCRTFYRRRNLHVARQRVHALEGCVLARHSLSTVTGTDLTRLTASVHSSCLLLLRRLLRNALNDSVPKTYTNHFRQLQNVEQLSNVSYQRRKNSQIYCCSSRDYSVMFYVLSYIVREQML